MIDKIKTFFKKIVDSFPVDDETTHWWEDEDDR